VPSGRTGTGFTIGIIRSAGEYGGNMVDLETSLLAPSAHDRQQAGAGAARRPG
jgi:hypothetical protein